MEKQEQQSIETLESQMSESSEKREEKNGATLPYCSPQVFLVGKAKRLMAGDALGHHSDTAGLYNYP